LKNWEEKLTEEDARCLRVSFRHIIHKFKAHSKPSILHFTIIVLASPHAGIDHEFELGTIKLQQGREAIQIDRLKQFKELNTMLWILVEIFVDHFQRAFKDAFHYGRYFVIH
jgi:hypothetical protein